MATKFTTESEALALLERIKAYWLERGYEVTGYVKPVGYPPGCARQSTKSRPTS